MLLANYGNSPDPRDERRFRRSMIHNFHDVDNGPAAIRAAEDRHVEWVRGFIIGAPIATEAYSSQELADQGMVGLYKANSPERYGKLVDYNDWMTMWNGSAWVEIRRDPIIDTPRPGVRKGVTCLDCKGSGNYTGLRAVEICQTCHGLGIQL